MEIFDKEALLASVDGDITDARELAETCLSELRRRLEKTRRDIGADDFPEIIIDAANIHGIALLLESPALMRTAEKITRLAKTGNAYGIAAAFMEIERLGRRIEEGAASLLG